jgi:tetratricopeptide (TPR) repeat protein
LYLACTEGRFEEAIAESRRACELDPLSGPAHAALGWVLFCAGRLRESEEAARRGLHLEPMLWTAYRVLGYTLGAQGRFEESVEMLEAGLPVSGRHVWIAVNLAEVLAVSGQADRARRLFDEIVSRSRTQYVQPLFFGLIHAALGDLDRAFEIYEQGLRERDCLPVMNYSPVIGSGLRKDPRYASIVRRLGLEPAPDLR